MLEGELVDASSAATPYMKMFGQVIGGYYMGKAAILAKQKLEETNDDFYADKITLSIVLYGTVVTFSIWLYIIYKSWKRYSIQY